MAREGLIVISTPIFLVPFTHRFGSAALFAASLAGAPGTGRASVVRRADPQLCARKQIVSESLALQGHVGVYRISSIELAGPGLLMLQRWQAFQTELRMIRRLKQARLDLGESDSTANALAASLRLTGYFLVSQIMGKRGLAEIRIGGPITGEQQKQKHATDLNRHSGCPPQVALAPSRPGYRCGLNRRELLYTRQGLFGMVQKSPDDGALTESPVCGYSALNSPSSSFMNNTMTSHTRPRSQAGPRSRNSRSRST
jgi:hypothetical protein